MFYMVRPTSHIFEIIVKLTFIQLKSIRLEVICQKGAEAYSESCQTSKMEPFANILSTILAERPIVDV